MSPERETFPFDILVLGGGPAGLSAAIRVAQLAQKAGREIQVGVVEKAAQCGLHCLSGAVFNPRALAELIPDYQAKGFPGGPPVAWDEFRYMLPTGSIPIPQPLIP